LNTGGFMRNIITVFFLLILFISIGCSESGKRKQQHEPSIPTTVEISGQYNHEIFYSCSFSGLESNEGLVSIDDGLTLSFYFMEASTGKYHRHTLQYGAMLLVEDPYYNPIVARRTFRYLKSGSYENNDAVYENGAYVAKLDTLDGNGSLILVKGKTVTTEFTFSNCKELPN